MLLMLSLESHNNHPMDDSSRFPPDRLGFPEDLGGIPPGISPRWSESLGIPLKTAGLYQSEMLYLYVWAQLDVLEPGVDWRSRTTGTCNDLKTHFVLVCFNLGYRKGGDAHSSRAAGPITKRPPPAADRRRRHHLHLQ